MSRWGKKEYTRADFQDDCLKWTCIMVVLSVVFALAKCNRTPSSAPEGEYDHLRRPRVFP